MLKYGMHDIYEPGQAGRGRRLVATVPIWPLSRLGAPFVTCVPLDRTDGRFEATLQAMRDMRDGIDYFHFS